MSLLACLLSQRIKGPKTLTMKIYEYNLETLEKQTLLGTMVVLLWAENGRAWPGVQRTIAVFVCAL